MRFVLVLIAAEQRGQPHRPAPRALVNRRAIQDKGSTRGRSFLDNICQVMWHEVLHLHPGFRSRSRRHAHRSVQLLRRDGGFEKSFLQPDDQCLDLYFDAHHHPLGFVVPLDAGCIMSSHVASLDCTAVEVLILVVDF